MRIPARRKDGRPRRNREAVLREAFGGALPDEILWRQKEQFSDGVGYSWIDSLKAHAEARVTDRQLAHARDRFPDQHAGHQGELPLPLDLRGAVPAAFRRRVRALRPQRRVLLAGRARVGSVVQGERGPQRASGQGRAQARGLTRRSPWRLRPTEPNEDEGMLSELTTSRSTSSSPPVRPLDHCSKLGTSTKPGRGSSGRWRRRRRATSTGASTTRASMHLVGLLQLPGITPQPRNEREAPLADVAATFPQARTFRRTGSIFLTSGFLSPRRTR